jgi:membrane protein implicated in regulation of membrane protease activity
MQGAAQTGNFEWARVIPSPRGVFSIMAMFGAFGYALLPLVHFWPLAAVLAFVPAWAIEYFAVRPLWNALFQFQGKPAAPIEALVTCDATAVTPFRNGKGLVAVEHNGQIVQFSARLQEAHASVPVHVGDKLCVEEVDSANQRMLVSVK